jgi:protocatechuate 4,5-dioxygenase alpha chain
MRAPQDYDDIPGTIVFDAERSREGYWLNQFCMSLMNSAHRTAFKADEAGYLNKWAMTPEQRQAVLDRDWNRMITLGGNIYFLAKIFSSDGKSFQHVAAIMTDSTQEAYAQMMIAGGRPAAGNRYQSEWDAKRTTDPKAGR